MPAWSESILADETKAPVTAFERFRYSFFENPTSPQDGLDLAALRALTGDERSKAEDMLLAYIPDARGVIGLGILRSKRAAAPLVSLLAAERQNELQAQLAKVEYWSDRPVDIAKALWYIDPEPRWLAVITDELATRPNWTTRMNAAQALFDVCDPDATKALVRALDDEEALVRHHAARGLLSTHGLPVDTWDPKHMLYRVMSKDGDRRAAGKKDILAAIDGRPLCSP